MAFPMGILQSMTFLSLSNQSTHPALPGNYYAVTVSALATGPLEEIDTVEESHVDESAL